MGGVLSNEKIPIATIRANYKANNEEAFAEFKRNKTEDEYLEMMIEAQEEANSPFWKFLRLLGNLFTVAFIVGVLHMYNVQLPDWLIAEITSIPQELIDSVKAMYHSLLSMIEN